MGLRNIESRRRFLGAAALAASIGWYSAAPAAEFELKYASSLTGDHPFNVRVRQMWKAVETESNGRVRTQMFLNSALGGDAAMLSQLRLGAIQFDSIYWGNLAPVVPAADIMTVGYVVKDDAEGIRIMDGPLGEYLREETLAKGLYALRSTWDVGMYQVGANSSIRNPDDMRGLKIRIPAGKTTVDLFKALGASPTSLSLNETYSALQSKLVDGEALTLATIEISRFYEVNKYINLTNHGWAGLWLLANAEAWNRLPSEIRNLIERHAKAYSLMEQRDIKALNDSLADKFARRGLGVVRTDEAAFTARLASYYESSAASFGPKAWGLLETSAGRKLG